jgi:hypothetical protein
MLDKPGYIGYKVWADMRFGRFGDTRYSGLDITAPYI